MKTKLLSHSNRKGLIRSRSTGRIASLLLTDSMVSDVIVFSVTEGPNRANQSRLCSVGSANVVPSDSSHSQNRLWRLSRRNQLNHRRRNVRMIQRSGQNRVREWVTETHDRIGTCGEEFCHRHITPLTMRCSELLEEAKRHSCECLHEQATCTTWR